MLVSEYIVDFLYKNKIKHAFGYPGGMVTYLMDAFSRYEGVTAHVNYHEQASSFAACGYASVNGTAGMAYATSGPGATNLLTGVANAYFDSIPVIFITGQVNTYESKGDMTLRQKGFQETDIISMAMPVTKMAVAVNDEKDIPYMLEKALYTACEGRKGPVLLDIPMNIQRQDIDPDSLKHFSPPESDKLEFDSSLVLNQINNAERPCIIVGAGIKQANVVSDFRLLAETLKIPVLTSMIAIDALPQSSPYSYGFVGAYGDRKSNFIASKADLIVTIGARLDCRQVGNTRKDFAINAQVIRLDIDTAEFENLLHNDDINLIFDLEKDMKKLIDDAKSTNIKKFDDWLSVCDTLAKKLEPTVEMQYPALIMKKLSEITPDNAIITTDVGQNQVWSSQHFIVKENQKILFSGGHGAMGYSLPAAIGASLSDESRIVLSLSGDGGFMMNLQELQFVARENLPIKICVFNNNALGMIRHFQEMYFDSRYSQTVSQNGYSIPSLKNIANAFGLSYRRIENLDEITSDIFDTMNPELIECVLPETTYVFPKLAMGKPIQDQEPPIDRELYNQLNSL